MKQAFLSFLVFCSLFLIVVACGRLNDKFGRSKSDYTSVKLSTNGDPRLAAQDGGMMVYFARNGGGNGGMAFAFPNELAGGGTPVAVPNGSYKVYALVWDGGGSALKAEGVSRCATGNAGADINLTGTSVTVSLNFSQGQCSFGDNGYFSSAMAADAGSNFDTITVQLCTGQPSAACNPVTSPTYFIKATILAGEKPGGSSTLIRAPNQPVQTSCVGMSGGTASTNWRIPVGPSSGQGVGPPTQISFYGSGDSTCSGPVLGGYELDGFDKYYNAASSSNVYLDSPSTSSYTYLKLFKYF